MEEDSTVPKPRPAVSHPLSPTAVLDADGAVADELRSYKAMLRLKREAALAEEKRQAISQELADAKLVEMTDASQRRGMQWEAWTERWEFTKAVERAQANAARRRLAALFALQELEEPSRAKVVEVEFAERAAISKEAARRHRHLRESLAWVEDWEAAWSERFAEMRNGWAQAADNRRRLLAEAEQELEAMESSRLLSV